MALEIVLITGMSGSGKSIALKALEDAGYYCVDNLPPELLCPFVSLEHRHHGNRLAIAMDVRSATSLPQVPLELERLRKEGVTVHSLFLDATTDTLVRRFSETRRRHPLWHDEIKEGPRALMQVIELTMPRLVANGAMRGRISVPAMPLAAPAGRNAPLRCRSPTIPNEGPAMLPPQRTPRFSS